MEDHSQDEEALKSTKYNMMKRKDPIYRGEDWEDPDEKSRAAIYQLKR
ncbi:MAG: hypothetical protein JRJ45_01380 [Deltaproteobacteria bacterium]|nr:hypothetical protein [Deltaproteobacteria bacterium]